MYRARDVLVDQEVCALPNALLTLLCINVEVRGGVNYERRLHKNVKQSDVL